MKNPYMIDMGKNNKMNCYEVRLTIGNFTEKEAKEAAKFLNEWMQENSEKGWSSRVN